MPKHRRRTRDETVVEDNDDMSPSSSEIDNDEEEEHRRSSRKESASKCRDKHKKDKKHKSKKKHKKKNKKQDSKRRRDSSDREDSSFNDDDDDSDDSRSRFKKRKKDKKSKKRHRREVDSSGGSPEDEDHHHNAETNIRSHILTQALCHLFTSRPLFAQELPILLIRLAGGSTFNLGQMNDYVASTALEAVLECLQEFGVHKTNGEWIFQAPPGRRDERVLLRVIRSLLDEVGVTMNAVAAHEAKMEKEKITVPPSTDQHKIETGHVKELTSNLVLKYQSENTDLGSQLAGLCQQIAKGQSISIDGLPDENLKSALEEIFVACGLEKSEMADQDESDTDGDDNNDDEEEEGSTMGYGLPEGASDEIQLRLAAVMEACRNPKRRVLGPMRPTQQAAATAYDSGDEDEGPALPGEGRRSRGPTLPAHVVKAQAEHRELELKATAAGIEIPKHSGGREEWMVVPGKYDFLSDIKSGQAIKSRGFQNKKTRGGDDDAPTAPIHPAIQAEMDAIMQAHQDARGPSLMDQHRSKKQQEKNEEAGRAKKWKWNREKDLDEGRRVDKDALHMVLGGAADNLKTKFHGGFD